MQREERPEYLTTNEAAQWLRVAPQTLRLWRLRGSGPRYTKPSTNRVLYSRGDLASFLAARTYTSTADESTRHRGDRVA